jgi:type IV pilus assembly protein PilC
MATASAKAPAVKAAPKTAAVKDAVYEWEGKDRNGKLQKGELRAAGEAAVSAALRRQGILVNKVKKRKIGRGGKIKGKDICVFTRQLATMMKAGVPLLQSFDIAARGGTNAALTRLLNDVRADVESGTSLSAAFRKHPMQFNALYCNLVEAGEAGGILETILDRLAIYEEKSMALQSKIKSALTYPIAVISVAIIVVTIIMIFVIPSFEDVFKSFGGELPAPTMIVIAMSKFFVSYWYIIFGALFGGGYFFMQSWKRSEKVQYFMDRLFLRVPVFGELIRKSILARWTRTLATLFGAGVPLVEALDSVAGASGNKIYSDATLQIQKDVATGTGLTTSMTTTGVFPNMVLQMTAIGEESGSLDHMLGKAADFYENEVDDMVKAMASLMEPFIIVILGTVIGGIVVSMYLPIFKLGQVV